MAELDRAVVDELLTTTRAVRKRLDLTRPVPREVVLECLRLAVQAPTGSNGQFWRWLVVTEPDTRAAIAELYRNPPGIAQACTGPVAYSTGEPFRPADRRPVEEITYWETWGATAP